MNTSQKLIALLSGAALLSVSSLAAQTATTAPVGYVTSTAADASDTYVGTVLSEQIALTSVASGVAGAVVSTASTLVEDAYNATHYVLFTTGAKDGQWYEVVDTTTNSVVLETDVAALGVTTGDEFKVIKFWTLATLFPSSSGFAVSVNPFSPVAQVLLNNLEATGINLSSASSYFYHDGSSPILSNTAGWYQVGSLVASGAIEIPAGGAFWIRKAAASPSLAEWAPAVPYSL